MRSERTAKLEAKQRGLERQVRRYKRLAEGTQDTAKAAEYRAKARQAQKRVREFVAEHGDVLQRDYWRERYDGTAAQPTAFTRGSGGTAEARGETVRQFLGKIDPADTQARETLIQAFCKKYASSPVENMMVITKNGEAHFITDHNPKKIDPADTQARETLIQAFCKKYASSPVENMMVITKNGEAHFITDHNPKGVDCSYLGDKLKGSWNIHTHPPDSTQFLFSTDVDMPNFFEDGSDVMEAVDYKYRYRFERPEGVTWEMWDKARYEVKGQIRSIMTERGFDRDDYAENVQHVLIEETCRKLHISSYSREVLK